MLKLSAKYRNFGFSQETVLLCPHILSYGSNKIHNQEKKLNIHIQSILIPSCCAGLTPGKYNILGAADSGSAIYGMMYCYQSWQYPWVTFV